ncbi:hypothetical protein JZ751_007475, partial [Albula glossodonta]
MVTLLLVSVGSTSVATSFSVILSTSSKSTSPSSPSFWFPWRPHTPGRLLQAGRDREEEEEEEAVGAIAEYNEGVISTVQRTSAHLLGGPVLLMAGAAQGRCCSGRVLLRAGAAQGGCCSGPVLHRAGAAHGGCCSGPVLLMAGAAQGRCCSGRVLHRAGAAQGQCCSGRVLLRASAAQGGCCSGPVLLRAGAAQGGCCSGRVLLRAGAAQGGCCTGRVLLRAGAAQGGCCSGPVLHRAGAAQGRCWGVLRLCGLRSGVTLLQAHQTQLPGGQTEEQVGEQSYLGDRQRSRWGSRVTWGTDRGAGGGAELPGGQTEEQCDSGLSTGWNRFSGVGGDILADFCVPEDHGGSHTSLWVSQPLPQQGEGVKTLQYCASSQAGCCDWNQTLSAIYCPGGFYLYFLRPTAHCSAFATHIDECTENPSVCGPNAYCSNTVGGYNCSCHHGYRAPPGVTLTNKTHCCQDVDECQENSKICGPNASCSNTMGSYTCQCDAGFIPHPKLEWEKDVTTCKDVTENLGGECETAVTLLNATLSTLDQLSQPEQLSRQGRRKEQLSQTEQEETLVRFGDAILSSSEKLVSTQVETTPTQANTSIRTLALDALTFSMGPKTTLSKDT